MGNYLSVLILGLAAAAQSTLVPQIRLLGGAPDVVFLIVVAWSVNASLDESVLWALIGGILQNLLSAAPLGTASMGMVLIVFALDAMRRQVYRVGLPLLILIIIFGSFLHQLVVMLILSLSGFEILFLDNLRYVVAPTIAYNLVFVWPIYWFIRRVQRRLTRRQRCWDDRYIEGRDIDGKRTVVTVKNHAAGRRDGEFVEAVVVGGELGRLVFDDL